MTASAAREKSVTTNAASTGARATPPVPRGTFVKVDAAKSPNAPTANRALKTRSAKQDDAKPAPTTPNAARESYAKMAGAPKDAATTKAAPTTTSARQSDVSPPDVPTAYLAPVG